ncbi:SEC-C metal-binding domain-containing protein [Pedobacter sp. D749]|uniref:SEC-C metal-binding domain-containing protein n=1 Tax=Pedobacter sp. D749 TaxID=2856523 RepID=UPI001C597CC4|nr:SEC-C metal-binding domain-containing protein [Pedobacter sp. D749]QXU43467.1 SEC-C domain-containing protein [Pedobacter sp. D749]
MSTILLDDLCYPIGFFGQQAPELEAFEKQHGLSRLLTALLTHDELVIRLDILEPVIELLGITNTLYLFRQGILRIIDDGGTSTAFLPNDGVNMLMNFSNSTALQLDAIHGRLKAKHTGAKVREMLDHLIFLADHTRIEVDGEWVSELVTREDASDLKNGRLTRLLGFEGSYTTTLVSDGDTLPLYRLNQSNKSLIYQQELGLTTLSTEFGTREIMSGKLGGYMAGKTPDPIALFKEIGTMKQLPDLANLYLNGVITIKAIVDMRGERDGRKFREWLESEDYKRTEVIKILASSARKGGAQGWLKHLRWLVPNLIGWFNTPAGVAVSAVDSYVVNNLLSGWHPNLFLDDVLTVGLEKHQKTARQLRDASSAARRAGKKIARNDLCPCGSGKKLKKCHGENI